MPCTDFRACCESHRAIPGRDISLPSVVVNSNAAAFTLVLRNFLLYLQECGKVERARLQIAPMFFLCLHPFIFLKLLGFVNEEKTRNQTIKDLDSKKVLMREPFWGRKKRQNQTENILKVYDLVKCCNLRETPQWSRGVRQFQTEEGRKMEEDMRDGKSPQLQHILCFSTFEKVFRWCKQSQLLLGVEEAGRSLDQFDCSSMSPNGLEQFCIMTNGGFKGFRADLFHPNRCWIIFPSQPRQSVLMKWCVGPVLSGIFVWQVTCYTHDRNWTGFNLLI